MTIVDAHVHLFPPAVRLDRQAYAARDPFFAQLYASPKHRFVDVEQLLGEMDAAGVAQAVMAGWAWQSAELCREHNDWAIEVAQQHGDRILALATIQPDSPGAVAELERCLDAGLCGLGELNADGQGFRLDGEGMLAVAAVARDRGVPVMLHTNEPVGHPYPGKGHLSPADIYEFIAAFPGLKIVLAHWGGGFPFYEMMPEVRLAARDVYYDSAASPLLYYPEVFRSVVAMAGPGKVIFGTDYPLNLYPRRHNVPGIAPLLEEVQSLGFSEEELREILGGNALRVYGRDGASGRQGSLEEESLRVQSGGEAP
jgi:predicted TIM-barrel fold metal-dependent hydrolase